MVKLRERLTRLACLVGLVALLAAAATFEPGRSLARPYDEGPISGDPYGSGDPTADDQPSPTPKPNSRPAAKWGVQATTASSIGIQPHRGVASSVRWVTYLKLAIRLGIR